MFLHLPSLYLCDYVLCSTPTSSPTAVLHSTLNMLYTCCCCCCCCCLFLVMNQHTNRNQCNTTQIFLHIVFVLPHNHLVQFTYVTVADAVGWCSSCCFSSCVSPGSLGIRNRMPVGFTGSVGDMRDGWWGRGQGKHINIVIK